MTDHNPQPPTEPGPDFQTRPQTPQPPQNQALPKHSSRNSIHTIKHRPTPHHHPHTIYLPDHPLSSIHRNPTGIDNLPKTDQQHKPKQHHNTTNQRTHNTKIPRNHDHHHSRDNNDPTTPHTTTLARMEAGIGVDEDQTPFEAGTAGNRRRDHDCGGPHGAVGGRGRCESLQRGRLHHLPGGERHDVAPPGHSRGSGLVPAQ